MQVIVNEQNKAYILKQQVAEGYTLDDKTQVVKNGLVYNKADDAPIAANPTDINNWVPVGTDFSGDISNLSSQIGTLNTNVQSLSTILSNESYDQGWSVNEGGHLKINVAPDSEDLSFINGLKVTEDGLKVSTYNLVALSGDKLDSNYAAQYAFKVDGKTLTTINIPKDQFLKSAEFIASLSVDDATTYGLESGKPHLKFTWQLDIDSSIDGVQNITFIPVKDLVDTYTGDNTYISIGNDNVISLDLARVARDVSDNLHLGATQLTVTELSNTINGKDDNPGLVAKVDSLTTKYGIHEIDIETINSTLGEQALTIGAHTKSITDINTEITAIKAQNVVNTIDDTAVNGINLTSSADENGKVTAKINVDIDTLATAVIDAANIPAPIAENIAVSAFGTTYTEDTNVQAVLESLDSRIKAAVSGGVTSVVAGVGINVTATDANNPTVSVKTSDLVVSGSALTVTDNKIDICWSEL